jgi:hypothetical protein
MIAGEPLELEELLELDEPLELLELADASSDDPELLLLELPPLEPELLPELPDPDPLELPVDELFAAAGGVDELHAHGMAQSSAPIAETLRRAEARGPTHAIVLLPGFNGRRSIPMVGARPCKAHSARGRARIPLNVRAIDSRSATRSRAPARSNGPQCALADRTSCERSFALAASA